MARVERRVGDEVGVVGSELAQMTNGRIIQIMKAALILNSEDI